MTTTRLYLREAQVATPVFSVQGTWAQQSPTVQYGLGAKNGTATSLNAVYSGNGAATTHLLGRLVYGPFTEAATVKFLNGVVGMNESNAQADAYGRGTCFITTGSTNTPRGFLFTNAALSATEFSTTLPPNGYALAATSSTIGAEVGDYLVFELGATRAANTRSLRFYRGGISATDLSPGNSAGTYPGWLDFDIVGPINFEVNDSSILNIFDGNILLGGVSVLDTWHTILKEIQELQISDMTVSNLFDSCNISTSNILSIGDSTIQPVLDQCDLSVFQYTVQTWYVSLRENASYLVLDDMTIIDSIDSITLEQHIIYTIDAAVSHPIEINDIAVASAFDECDLLLGTLSVDDSTIVCSFDNVALTQTYNFGMSDMNILDIFDDCDVSETPGAIADMTIEAIFDSVDIVEICNLGIDDMTISTVLDFCFVTRDDSSLFVDGIKTRFVFDDVSITQLHKFTVSDMYSGLSFDSIRLSGFWFEDSLSTAEWHDYDKSSISWNKE